MKQKKRKLIGKTVVGVIKVHRRGFGFLIPDDRERYPEDIFIPRKVILGAVDGDRVEVVVNPHSYSEKGPEGAVKKILSRGRSHLAGTISFIGKNKQFFAYVPLLGEEGTMQIVPSQEHHLKLGDRIIIHVLDWGSQRRAPLGEMSAYIGHISDPSSDIRAAIEEFELNSEFSEETLEEAKRFGNKVTAKQMQHREDLRNLRCFTIDPDTAKDFDDALSLHRDGEGKFHLGVHIADVSYYVRPNTSLDEEALSRCNSTYFPGTVIPMLPHELSSHLCSLKPNVNRLAVTVFAILGSDGELQDYRICRSVIKSKKRFSYKEAKQVLDGTLKSPFAKDLHLMVELCRILKKKRAARGSIEFSLPDTSIKVNANGEVTGIEVIEYDITHQLVEEFMLLANETVATHLSRQSKPLTYRIHEEPNPENIKDFALLATSLGYKLPNAPSAEELQKLFDEAAGTPFSQFLATSFIRSMKLAAYSTDNIGHFGLCLEHYTHFTSPIRRYIDLMVHRALFDEIKPNDNLEEIALQCSEKERLSSKAENSVTFLKKLRYLQARKKEKLDTYEAIIVAIKPFGLFFELKEFIFEGFLPLQDKRLALGCPVRVQLLEIDLITRQTEWTLLE